MNMNNSWNLWEEFHWAVVQPIKKYIKISANATLLTEIQK